MLALLFKGQYHTLMSPITPTAAVAHCERIARRHYENFPVASRLLPARIRRPIAVIYAFARGADDLADEGDAPAIRRLEALETYRTQLDAIAAGEPLSDPVFIALAEVIREHQLPMALFYDLLSAFSQDVTQRRYRDFDELLDYCRRSANPVGRLMLHLTGHATAENLKYSDAVCTALQLINFWQDLSQDYDENQRIYLPEDEMRQFAVTERHLMERLNDENMLALMNAQLVRTRSIMLAGAPLGRRLPGLFGVEIRAIILGGMEILTRLNDRMDQGDVFTRPRLSRLDGVRLIWRAILKR